jgi:hypothetical protein
VPDIVYRKFEEIIGQDIPLLEKGGRDVLSIHTYELSPYQKHGEQRDDWPSAGFSFARHEPLQGFGYMVATQSKKTKSQTL